MKFVFYALALYVGYRIAVENRRESASAKLLAPPMPHRAQEAGGESGG